MVANCFNPRCGRSFRQLSKGHLFLLPPPGDSVDAMWKVERLTDHCYWLCPECSRDHVIVRVGPKLIISRKEGHEASPCSEVA